VARIARLVKSEMECNKPQRAPAGSDKKFIVKACDGGREKIIRYGARGYEDYTQHKDKERRDNFHARHNCDEKKDKLTPGWWACNELW
jgi:hypothetical protein